MNTQPLVDSFKANSRYITPPLLLFCGGFLFTVLWFTLMADVRALGYPSDIVPEPVLDSIATFYQTIFGPMSILVRYMFFITLFAITRQLTISSIPLSLRISTFLLNVPPILLALFNIVPNAERFASRIDTLEVQSQLLQAVYRDHMISIICISLFCVLQITTVIQLQKRAVFKQ